MPKTSPFSLALITGASSGIGEGLCRLLAIKGIPLIITGRNEQKLNLLADELKNLVSVEVIIADISSPNERQKLIAVIHQLSPDLIINNAGFGLYGHALTYETHEQMAILDVNIAALLELTLEGARELLSAGKRGVIMNISSSADLLIFPGLAVYAASKAFVTLFSRSFDEEMRSFGIRVLASCPGVVDTGFRHQAAGMMAAKPDALAMTVPFAAQQIWNQILKTKKVHRFDWKTRIAAFIARNFIPQHLVARYLFRKTESYHLPRSLKPKLPPKS